MTLNSSTKKSMVASSRNLQTMFWFANAPLNLLPLGELGRAAKAAMFAQAALADACLFG
ncbi:hypothetical protein [Roseobacter sp. HKCCD5988]|uniref:hypothetical protein n=1 Tax=Roseobacter sp. HKCCD5988 TaxID=3120338 RepID=UPI0030EBC4EA